MTDKIDTVKRLRVIRRLSGPVPSRLAAGRLERIVAVATGEENPDDVFKSKQSSTLAQRLIDGQASRSPRRTTQPSGKLREGKKSQGMTAAAEAERDALDEENRKKREMEEKKRKAGRGKDRMEDGGKNR